MLYLVNVLFREESLGLHQGWVFAIFLVLSLVFTGAARFLRDEQGRRYPNLVITAWFLWALLFERGLLIIRYEFLIYEEYRHFVPAWVIARHLSLLNLELPAYAACWVLLRDNIKGFIRNYLKEWLNA